MPDTSFTQKGSTCCLCQNTTSRHSWNAVLLAPVCQRCCTVFGYGTPNGAVVGRPLKRFPSFSLEFEVATNAQIAPWELDRALLLVKHRFKRTQDGTVDYEYKSPIYHSVRSARPALAVMDTLVALVSDRCGTHLHVACRNKDLLLPVLGDVFSPLLTHMLQYPEETTLFWGRYFNTFATPVNRDRYHCFSLESKHPTLEFRLPRFRTAEQYLRVIKFARASVAYLNRVMEEVSQEQCAQPASSRVTQTSPGVQGLPSRALGHHVLGLYRAHVARVKSENSWFARLSLEEQLQAQTFAPMLSERRARIEISDDEDEDLDRDGDDEEDTDDWRL